MIYKWKTLEKSLLRSFSTYLIQLNDIRMSDNLENVNLSRHTFDIGLVFDLIFFQNLDCNFLASDQMSSQSYFTECALSERTTWRK